MNSPQTPILAASFKLRRIPRRLFFRGFRRRNNLAHCAKPQTSLLHLLFSRINAQSGIPSPFASWNVARMNYIRIVQKVDKNKVFTLDNAKFMTSNGRCVHRLNAIPCSPQKPNLRGKNKTEFIHIFCTKNIHSMVVECLIHRSSQE